MTRNDIIGLRRIFSRYVQPWSSSLQSVAVGTVLKDLEDLAKTYPVLWGVRADCQEAASGSGGLSEIPVGFIQGLALKRVADATTESVDPPLSREERAVLAFLTLGLSCLMGALLWDMPCYKDLGCDSTPQVKIQDAVASLSARGWVFQKEDGEWDLTDYNYPWLTGVGQG